MEPQDKYNLFLAELTAIEPGEDDDPSATIAETFRIAADVDASDLPDRTKALLLFTASSLTLNAAFESGDENALNSGKRFAEVALASSTPEEPFHFQCRYNIANALNSLCDLKIPKTVAGAKRADWEPAFIESWMMLAAERQSVRREYFEIGISRVADDHTRSSALCNLANQLDHSGRWAEAYDFYLRALEADPRNGNAAGNLAQLLRSRLHTGLGQAGHIAAVHDKYVRLAQDLRDGTLAFASATVANRWDDMALTDSEGHLSHGLDDVDAPDADYRTWVADLRLALSPAVEGLGTDELRWDSATIEVLYGASVDEMSPPILGAMNVLKSDFLVSRRLAFDGITQMGDDFEQSSDDSGSYSETFDYSLYGVPYSKLLLAQRSALDVLDKTAVVANEHFDVGDLPKRVSFRGFWTTKDGGLRTPMVKGPGRSLPNLALAELASDMESSGIYAKSQALRNAGTHRIVHAAWLAPTGVTQDTRSKIDLLELIESTILALQVTRSAYLYLIDLVAQWNHPDDHPGAYLPFPDIRYLHDPTAIGLTEPGDDAESPDTNSG